MANAKYLLRSNGGGLEVETLRFFPDTAADPEFTCTADVVESVVHSADGKYLVTLRDTPYEVKAIVPSMSVVGDATDAAAQGGVLSGRTFYVKTKAGATNADFAANASTHVDVIMIFKRNNAHV